MNGRAIVCGGSIGGLFCAAALRRAGWDVVVAERSRAELSGRGAGIVTHPALVAALGAVGAATDALGVAVAERVAYGRDGARVHAIPSPQIVTSWDRIHGLLRALLPDGAYRLGLSLADATDTGTSAVATFADGSRLEGDVVVGADGFRSAVRALQQPEIEPAYAGYVVWRSLANEADLSPATRAELFPAFGFFCPAGMQVLGYPIAGPDNDLTPGQRRYNVVWYVRVQEAALANMLTDAAGERHTMTIPPPLVRDDLIAAQMEAAEQLLPPGFVEMLAVGERPFFTPIYDLCAPAMARGRIALAGDAAAVARPHVGMGVTKAAMDAAALTAALCAHDDVAAALAAYSAERVPAARAAYDRARHLGRFIVDGAGDAAGRANPHIEEIVRTTAVDVATLPPLE